MSPFDVELPGMPDVPAERLYGRPGDERLHRDPVDVWDELDDPEPFTIEEWSTTGFGSFVRSAGTIIENVVDWAADEVGFEDAHEALTEAGNRPDVIAAFEKARNLLIEKAGTGWLFADRLLRTGTITTVVEDGKSYPLILWEAEKKIVPREWSGQVGR